jgi:tetratricopeptide (TPR) repeat protein
MIKRICLTAAVLLCILAQTVGQDSRLANQYYRSGEYEKAAQLFKKLYEKNRRQTTYFTYYINSLLEIEAYKEAETSIKGAIKQQPGDLDFYVSYGNLYEKQFDQEKADQQYRVAISKLGNNPGQIQKLGNAFRQLAKYDLAIEAYEKGQAIVGEKYDFSTSLAALYQQKGEYKPMIKYYLDGIDRYEQRLASLENTFIRVLPEEYYDELQSQLYTRIQDQKEGEEQPLYTELLEWTFIHRKQYDKALRQARAMDRKYDENGGRVYDVAQIAANDNDFDTALKGYEYITTQHGPNTSYYLEAKLGFLNTKRKQIIRKVDYTTEDLRVLEGEYVSFLNEFGKNTETAKLIKQLAYLQAYYLDDITGAIGLLEEVKDYAGLADHEVADAKLELGDLYLISGDIWESTLLYSQVDKKYKEGALGEKARYKNARLSYFNGDFEWAQAQFDILKSATTRLISNDAIDMSVFITDNMGLDTTDVPLKMYADSELLLFQSKYDESLARLDEIKETFPEHSLTDDILYLKAQIYTSRREYDKAVALYETIIEKYPEEIRADNSLFELAELYEQKLANPEKAKELYKQLYVDFSASTLATEARKRFRILRGDDIG